LLESRDNPLGLTLKQAAKMPAALDAIDIVTLRNKSTNPTSKSVQVLVSALLVDNLT
jgi:hypothetical protein